MRRIFALLLCLVLAAMACSVSLTGDGEGDVDSAVETAIAETQAARPTDTPAPTDTPVPVPTNTPVPTEVPTEAPEPTDSTAPEETDAGLEGVAVVEFRNNIHVPVTVKLKGPETRTFTIRGNSKMTVEFEAGEYACTASAEGFIFEPWTTIFLPGENVFTFGKAED